MPAAAVQILVPSTGASVPVPRSYLGLSTEYWGLPLFDRYQRLLLRALSLVHVAGDGPLVLRVGGDSADATFWDPRRRRLPAWAFALAPSWFGRMAVLLDRTHARLILDLNLVTDTPAVAAELAAAARRYLPHRSILGFEVGNEPDLYSRSYWTSTYSREGLQARLLPSEISAASYTRDFNAYARVLARVAPGLTLVGPALAFPRVDLGWLTTLLAGARPRPGIVSAHLYPYSPCLARSSPSFPTIPRLLAASASTGLARTIAPAVRLVHRLGLPLRLTELNSVTCGGLAGVSDTFATSLWAPDALFSLMRAGVDGVNVHVRARTINGAFALTSRGLIARPLLYGLILFARTAGPHGRLLRVQTRSAGTPRVQVWAVRVPGAVHVLMIDKTARATTVELRLPGAIASATVQTLLAPSAAARSGLTLAGQHLTRGGRWAGRLRKLTVAPGAGGSYRLTVRGLSAALLSVPAPPAAPGHATR